jgi:hypothetical protein
MKGKNFAYTRRPREQWQKRTEQYEESELEQWQDSFPPIDEPLPLRGRAKRRSTPAVAVPTRKGKSKWDKLNGALEENFLTLMAIDKDAGLQLIRLIPIELYGNETYRTLVTAMVRYYQKYGDAPGLGHLPDLVEKKLASESAKVPLLEDALRHIDILAGDIKREYVLDQVQEFVSEQELRLAITRGAEELERGKRQESIAALAKGIERAGQAHSEGLLGLDGAVHRYREFRNMEFPPTEPALYPVLVKPGITQINGPRGHGKTEVALYMGVGLVGGIDVFGWECKRPHRVLFVDAELPKWEMQKRLEGVIADLGPRPKKVRDNFHLLSVSDLSVPINLADPAQTDELVDYFTQYDVAILDSITMLTSGIDLNDAKDWETINSLCTRCRDRGTSIIRLQHLGKDRKKGGLGSSRQEFPLNFCMQIEQETPKLFHANAVIHVTCTKIRNYAPTAFKPVDLELSTGSNGLIKVTHDLAYKSKTEAMLPEIIELMMQGKWKNINQTNFAEQYDADKSTVSRTAKKAEEVLRRQEEEESLAK